MSAGDPLLNPIQNGCAGVGGNMVFDHSWPRVWNPGVPSSDSTAHLVARMRARLQDVNAQLANMDALTAERDGLARMLDAYGHQETSKEQEPPRPR